MPRLSATNAASRSGALQNSTPRHPESIGISSSAPLLCVILASNRHRQHNLAEINIHASQFDISAHAENTDLYAGIDFAIDKVEAQLRKHKDRINDRKGRASLHEIATMIPVDVVSEHDEQGATRIIETETLHAKPLSVDDAVMQLELTHSEFLVFKNSANNTISVVYKRRDGHYGLIIPTA